MKGSQNSDSGIRTLTQNQQQEQEQMIATASNNTTPIHWVEGNQGDDCGGTVISEITSDQTFSGAATGPSEFDLLGIWPEENANMVLPMKKAPGSPKKGDDGSHTDKPTSIKSASTASATTNPAGTKKASAKSSTSSKSNNSTNSKSPSAGQKPKADPRSRSNTPPKNSTTANSTKPHKKKAPHPAMDVSPNPYVKKVEAVKAGLKEPPKTTAQPTSNTTNRKPPPSTATPSNAGLSELSKQLRVQRAKNEWQHNEIARLERQLRILSDLKGISVADLRFSLESACQEEAHGELRNQVMSLQAQLEALQMQRNTHRRASTANDEAAQSKIATLQLRIGEFEEVDQAKQQELQHLYQQLQEQKERATTLEATNAQLKAQLDKFEQVAKMYIKDVEQIQAERDALRQQVEELKQQLANQDNQRRLDQAMKEIEDQIELEQKRKQDYLNQARQQARSVGPTNGGPPVNGRLTGSQLAAIQGVVGQQAGVSAPNPVDASTIATSIQDDGSMFLSSGSNSIITGPREGAEDDDVSHLGDDMSIHTMDALLMQGLTEEQAKQALAKDAKIASLYEELREQATKASQLQTLCANQKAQLDRFAEQLNEKEETLRSTQSNYDFAKSEHESLYERFCDIELQLNLEQDRVEGLERQLNARTRESDMRKDQFKCRFQMQNERIQDLEQQQHSLYTAFELLQKEVNAQDSEHNKLKSSLGAADHEVARQLRDSEKKDNKSSRRRPSGAEPSSPLNASRRHSLEGSQRRLLEGSQRRLLDGSMSNVGGSDPPVATATPVQSGFASMNDSSAHMQHHSAQEQSAFQQGIVYPMRVHGYLWKLDKIKGWKRRFFVLYGEGGIYQMTYSDGPKERVKGTIDNITMGVSTVAETNKSIKRPYSFVLHVDPLQHSGQVLYAAAPSAEEFKRWMNALKAATIRPEDIMFMSQPNLSSDDQLESDMEMARRLQSASSRELGHNPDQESQVESDHVLAMRLQIQNAPNQAFA